jgi:hypothetical protein
MRAFLLLTACLLAFGATMAFTSTDANAVVCARGVYRAGCAGYRGAVVVRRPYVPYARRAAGRCWCTVSTYGAATDARTIGLSPAAVRSKATALWAEPAEFFSGAEIWPALG